jgi:hypothetical protein
MRTECQGRCLDLEGRKTSWRKLHNDELHSLCSSPNIVRVIESRRVRWVGHVACRGRGEAQREETTGKT